MLDVGIKVASKCRAIVLFGLSWALGKHIGGGSPMTGSSIELVSDWLLMTAHNGSVFLLDPGLGVFCCISRKKGLEHVVDCACDGWDGVDFWERLVVRIFLACSLVTSPCYMLLNTRLYVLLGFINVETVAIFMSTRDLIHGTGGSA